MDLSDLTLDGAFDSVASDTEGEMEMDSGWDTPNPQNQEEPTEETAEQQEIPEGEDQEQELDDNKNEEQEEESTEELPLVDEIRQKLGYEIEGEYEDTPEGLFRLTEAAGDKIAESTLDRIFNQHPEVQQFLEYAQNGGEPEKFFQTMYPSNDYSEVEVQEDNFSQQRGLIKESLSKQGYTDDEVSEMLDDFEGVGILENQAKRALNYLQRTQQNEQKQLIEQQKAEAERREKEIQEFWDGVKSTIDETQELGGVTIPKSDKDEFFSYISKEQDNGMTQRDLDAREMSTQERLFLDYLVYQMSQNGGLKAMEGLISRKASSQQARSLRERFQRSNNDSLNGSRSGGGSGSGDASSIADLDTIFNNA